MTNRISIDVWWKILFWYLSIGNPILYHYITVLCSTHFENYTRFIRMRVLTYERNFNDTTNVLML